MLCSTMAELLSTKVLISSFNRGLRNCLGQRPSRHVRKLRVYSVSWAGLVDLIESACDPLSTA